MTTTAGNTTTGTLTGTLTTIAGRADKATIAEKWLAEKATEKAAQVEYEAAEAARKATGCEAAEVFAKDELVTVHGNRTIRFTTKATGQAPKAAILDAILPTLTPEQRVIYDAHMAEYEANRGEAYAFAEPTAAQKKAMRR